MSRKEPFVRDEAPGTRIVCSCGKSEMLPYCDGTHTETRRYQPCVVNIENAKQIAWCGCRRSKDFPFCDGTHETL